MTNSAASPSSRVREIGKVSLSTSAAERANWECEGWRPWPPNSNWVATGKQIVVPYLEGRGRKKLHAKEYVDNAGIRFAALWLDDAVIFYWFFNETGSNHISFECKYARWEGYWRKSKDEPSALPWPASEGAWPKRSEFLLCLVRAEEFANVDLMRGFSKCRCCGQLNGSKEYQLEEWRWPEGLKHYIECHEVRPSDDFLSFIMDRMAAAEV